MREPRMRYLIRPAANMSGDGRLRLAEVERFVYEAKRAGFAPDAEVNMDYDVIYMVDRIRVSEVDR